MYEGFVSNTENDQIVEKIFTILGYSLLTLVVYGTLAWSYFGTDKNQNLFISLYSLFVLFYAIIIIVIVVINKDNYDLMSYTMLFGLSIFVIFTTFFISVFFVLKYFNILSSSSSKNSDAVANMEYRGYQ
jgi:hypothetical protein